ncbi:hypothetical protein PVA38_12350 [Streptococcus pneumoniae D39]|nr:hypothetical protein PVA38_12350 [Streptococcus pneumoniae D39]
MPKPVMINKLAFTELINLMIAQLEISSDDVLYLPSHIAFIQSLWAAMIVIFSGGRVIFKDRITSVSYTHLTLPTKLSKVRDVELAYR